jgi:hypothetical protein
MSWIGTQASPREPRWPRLLIGAVLLWRALCVAAVADSAEVLDSRFLSEWSSPGLNRSVRQTFTNHDREAGAHSATTLRCDP